MRHVRRVIDEGNARNVLSGERRGVFVRLLRQVFSSHAPLKIEPVWLPFYLVTIAFERSSGPNRVTCSIEGFSGSFAIFEMFSALDDGSLDGESFSPAIDSTNAERLARESLVTTLLRRSGQARRAVPAATESVELLLWPYWVYYHRRRNGRLDIQLLDAATGQRPGHKIKLGLLEAFRAKQRASNH